MRVAKPRQNHEQRSSNPDQRRNSHYGHIHGRTPLLPLIVSLSLIPGLLEDSKKGLPKAQGDLAGGNGGLPIIFPARRQGVIWAFNVSTRTGLAYGRYGAIRRVQGRVFFWKYNLMAAGAVRMQMLSSLRCGFISKNARFAPAFSHCGNSIAMQCMEDFASVLEQAEIAATASELVEFPVNRDIAIVTE